jgi:SagB-type dehydrogenase family enzyme
MKKYFLVFTIFLLFNFCNNKVGEVIKLPEPQREGGMPLYEALNHRKTSRDFNESADISLELLSQALWSCYGFAEDNHRTVPSTKGWYPFIIYVFTKDGVFKYNPENHELLKLFDDDYRILTGTQTEVVTKAAVNFVFIGDLRKESSKMYDDDNLKKLAMHYDIGHISMNLYLFASANNMKSVLRGNYDSSTILKFLGLSKNDYVLDLTFSLGY